MSRSEQFNERKQSPVSAILEWKAKETDGFFSVYDKEAGDIAVKELSFVLLGERSCVNGYYAKQNTGAWSNEVKDTTKEPMTVMYKKDGKVSKIAEGLYKAIKPEVESAGLKFHKAVYAMVYNSDEVADGTIVKLMLKGAALYAWSQFRDSGGAKQGIKFTGASIQQNGAIKYNIPLFEAEALAQDVSEESELAYEQVKSYLGDSAKGQEHEEPAVQRSPSEDDIPF